MQVVGFTHGVGCRVQADPLVSRRYFLDGFEVLGVLRLWAPTLVPSFLV